MNKKLEQSIIENTPRNEALKVAEQKILGTVPEKFCKSDLLKNTFWPGLIRQGLTTQNITEAKQKMDNLFKRKFQPARTEDYSPDTITELETELEIAEDMLANADKNDAGRNTIKQDIETLKIQIDQARSYIFIKNTRKKIATQEAKLTDKKYKKEWPDIQETISDLQQQITDASKYAHIYVPDPDFEKIKQAIFAERKKLADVREHKTFEPVFVTTSHDNEASYTPEEGSNITESTNKWPDAIHFVGSEKDEEAYQKNIAPEKQQKGSIPEKTNGSVDELLAELSKNESSLANMLRDDYDLEKHPDETLLIEGVPHTVVAKNNDEVTLAADDEQETRTLDRKTFDTVSEQAKLRQGIQPDTHALRAVLETVEQHENNGPTNELADRIHTTYAEKLHSFYKQPKDNGFIEVNRIGIKKTIRELAGEYQLPIKEIRDRADSIYEIDIVFTDDSVLEHVGKIDKDAVGDDQITIRDIGNALAGHMHNHNLEPNHTAKQPINITSTSPTVATKLSDIAPDLVQNLAEKQASLRQEPPISTKTKQPAPKPKEDTPVTDISEKIDTAAFLPLGNTENKPASETEPAKEKPSTITKEDFLNLSQQSDKKEAPTQPQRISAEEFLALGNTGTEDKPAHTPISKEDFLNL